MATVILDVVYLFWRTNNFSPGYTESLPEIAFILFILTSIFYFRGSIGKADSINFIDLLWRAFVTGLITTVLSLVIKLFLFVFDGHSITQNFVFVNLLYEFNIGLVLVFTLSGFIIFKRLILYQKTKRLLRAWNIYEIALAALLIIGVLDIIPYSPFFFAIAIPIILFGVVLSVNMKWVAYLNFKQKWKAILFIVLTLIYLLYYIQNLNQFGNNYIIQRNLFDSPFFLAIFSFIIAYSSFSLLVILFNLPTSSVFEQKMEEAMNFQKLSRAIPTGENEEQVYDILLSSAMSAVFADSAWIDIKEDHQEHLIMSRNITDENIRLMEQSLSDSKSKNFARRSLSRLTQAGVEVYSLRGTLYRSALIVPIEIEKKKTGELILLKEVSEGFNREMAEIITAFVNQACVSIENFRLIQNALENERYKEELKIAKKVQQSLLPEELIETDAFSIAAFSEAADEVGGDYYDILQSEEGKAVIIVGDVSGKGTSAAFNMSQMKGVFHSLAPMDISPEDFLVRANDALGSCLEKTSFITATIFQVDIKERKIVFARAGHCPTLFYCASKDESYYFKNIGLGLGILRNKDYQDYVQQQELQVEKGDVIILYTDGITESRNKEDEEFGYDRLREFLVQNSSLSPIEIKERLLEEFYRFCGTDKPLDDYTFMIIKFN
ncbi:MAG: PP2C family protein-serine/threonine phosphatase [Bacteroidota bacterium]